MKASKYTYIIDRNGSSYWYNGIEHTYFKLPIDLGHKVRSLISSTDTIGMLPDAISSKLINGGFIIDDAKEEIDVIKDKFYKEVNRKDYMLTILPTLDCNFKCWYCIQNHIPSKMSKETIDAVKQHISYMINAECISSLRLEWFGGEPLMYFKDVIMPISMFAKECCSEKGIPYSNSATTNGYFLTPDKIIDLKSLQFKSFQITLDGPEKEHNRVKNQSGCDSAFKYVLTNIENILTDTDDIRILLRINYTEKNLSSEIVSEINQYISYGNRRKITVSLKKVWQEKIKKERFNKIYAIQNLFQDSGYAVRKLDIINNFIPCYVNRKYYNTINYNGDVVKCTASNDLYGSNPHGKLMQDGSIQWPEGYLNKYEAVSFENKICLNCKYLPICMGRCPRDYDKPFYCKLKLMDFNIEDALVYYIDSSL